MICVAKILKSHLIVVNFSLSFVFLNYSTLYMEQEIPKLTDSCNLSFRSQ